MIGAQAAARSAADGYTFYFATTAAMVTNASSSRRCPTTRRRTSCRSPSSPAVRSRCWSGPSPRSLEDSSRAARPSRELHARQRRPAHLRRHDRAPVQCTRKAGANLVSYASVNGGGTQDLIGGHVDAMVADLASTAHWCAGPAATARRDLAEAHPRLGERARAGGDLAGPRHGGLARRRRAAARRRPSSTRMNAGINSMLAGTRPSPRSCWRSGRLPAPSANAAAVRCFPARGASSASGSDRRRDRLAARMID